MPSKSRNTKGKQPHKSRKSKAIQRQGTVFTNPETSPTPVQVDKKENLPSVESGSLPSKTPALVYPHITGELKRIGILAAIIFIVLIILAIVIP